jgi:subtilisin family serine protease
MDQVLSAWSLPAGQQPALRSAWPQEVTRDVAWGGSTGAGVRVCVVDSGIDASHPAVGAVDAAVTVETAADGTFRVVADTAGDVSGHGTACAGIIRSLAPDCELASVRVLGSELTASGGVLLAGLEWAVEQGFDVVNLSLSTRKRAFVEALHDLVDTATFRGSLIVASAHNVAVESYPWRFSSVISVGSHAATDPFEYHRNPSPPVHFFARGVGVPVAWPGGGSIVVSGNSFATPHIGGLCALILGRHPGLAPFEVHTLLSQAATNVRSEPT